MPDYSKGQIYSIRFYHNDKMIYIGSTTQPLAVRLGGHKSNTRCSLYQYIQKCHNGNFKRCYIELLEYYECANRQELNKREDEIIRKFKADENYIVINTNIAGRTANELNKENVAMYKEYKNEHPEEFEINQCINENDEPVIECINKIKAYRKEYYQENVDKIKAYQKEYRQKQAKKQELLA
jgi:hypothetical protein